MSKDLDTILAIGEKIQQNWELRRKMETFVEADAHLSKNIAHDIYDVRDSITREIEEETKKLDTCPLWKEHVWPTLALELNLTSLNQQANIARTLHFVFKALRYTGVIPIVRAPENLKLTNTTSSRLKEQVYGALKANKYLTTNQIVGQVLTKRSSVSFDAVRDTLSNLREEGRIIYTSKADGKDTWKKPIKKYTKMKKFEWKKMIVEVLDMHSGKQLTHQEIVGAIKHQYGLGSPPEALHGSIGSALDRLSKDGKLKRFHRKKVKSGYVYWTTPVPKLLPLPLPPTEKKR